MHLFAYEIEFRSRRVAIQTGLLQRRIEHFVSTVQNRRAVRRDLQSEELPAVSIWKGCSFMLYHCLGRDQLQDCTCRIFLIGHAVLKDLDGFFELLGSGILNPRVPNFLQVEQAAKAFLCYHKVISRNGDGQIEKQSKASAVAHYLILS